MKIFFASDHAGFEMKGSLIGFVKELGFEVEDYGAYELNAEDDYPEFVKKAAQKVSEDPENAKAIVLGGSGQGEAMAANRFLNIRASVFYGGPKKITNFYPLMRQKRRSNFG
jgi:ribose 5-phosphate isomerase B